MLFFVFVSVFCFCVCFLLLLFWVCCCLSFLAVVVSCGFSCFVCLCFAVDIVVLVSGWVVFPECMAHIVTRFCTFTIP